MSRQGTGRFKIGGRRYRRTNSRVTPVKRSAERQFAGLVPALVGLVAFAGGVIGVHYGWQALTSSSRLSIRVIDVEGNERVRSEEISAYTDLAIGDPILRADLDAAALKLRMHPWVQRATIQRRLPDRVQVTVKEREPAVVVALGELYLADSDGQVFKHLGAEDRVVLPVVTGVQRGEAEQSPENTKALIRSAIDLVGAFTDETQALGRVEEVHWDPDLGWSVVTRPSVASAAGVRLHLGMDPIPRLETASSALARLQQHSLVPEVIWADGLKNPSRVQARLRDEALDRDATYIAKAR